MKATFKSWTLLFSIGILACAIAGATHAQGSESVSRGKALFDTNCATCHGRSATGDGSVAKHLTVKPADLTRLSQHNGSEFPTEAVYKKVDGREEVKTHGKREMPIWGKAFEIATEEELKKDPDSQARVERRIRAVVDYLETLQLSDDS